MDSITIDLNHSITNNHGFLFTIVQDSIRFERTKQIVVYAGRNLLGVYSVASKVVFKRGEFPRMISYLTFGIDQQEAKQIVFKNVAVKGRKDDNTQLALIALFYEGSNVKFEIPELSQNAKLQESYRSKLF